jgi:hypothetical protein
VVNWQGHGGMVLISGLFPCIWEKKQKVEKQKKSTPIENVAPVPQDSNLKNCLNKHFNSSPVPAVRCGLHWVAHLGDVNYRKAAEVLRILRDSNDTDFASQLKNIENLKDIYLNLLRGLWLYLKKIEGVVTESAVMRPSRNKKDESWNESASVTSIKANNVAQKALLDLIGKIQTADPIAIFHELRIIFGMADYKEIDRKFINSGAADWYRIFDYFNHAMHTEVQIIVAQGILNDPFLPSSPIISTKLPCWSCIRLPWNCTAKTTREFFALRTGIHDLM